MSRLAALVRRLGEAIAAAGSPPRRGDLTAAHFVALGKLIGALPVEDLVALVQGPATADKVLDLAEQAAGLVAAAFPPAAITAREVQFGLEALQVLLGAAGVGGKPLRVEPGQNPLRGGFEGARGHI